MAAPAWESEAKSSTSAGRPPPGSLRTPAAGDRVAAVLALQRSAGNAATVAMLQRMAACPTRLQASDPAPEGWKPYYGNSDVFHCGFRGILEDRKPTPDDPQNECFYDEHGNLIDENSPYADCGGSPNQYNSETDKWDHTFNDEGGIWHKGWDAFWESRIHPVKKKAREADSWFARQKARWLYGGW
jgi:hypothetical protein